MGLLVRIRSSIGAHRVLWSLSAALIVVALVVILLVLNADTSTNTSNENTTSQPSSDTQSPEASENIAEQPQVNQTIKPSNDPLTEKALAAQFEAKDFCSKLEKACFTYPPGWILKTITSNDTTEEVHITSPSGTTLVWQYDAPSQLPGSCDAAAPIATTSHFNSMPHENGDIYFIATGPSQYTDHIGILDKLPHVPYHPPLGSTGVCSKLYIPTFKSRTNPNVLVSFRNLGHDPMLKADIEVATEIIRSFRYQ